AAARKADLVQQRVHTVVVAGLELRAAGQVQAARHAADAVGHPHLPGLQQQLAAIPEHEPPLPAGGGVQLRRHVPGGARIEVAAPDHQIPKSMSRKSPASSPSALASAAASATNWPRSPSTVTEV